MTLIGYIATITLGMFIVMTFIDAAMRDWWSFFTNVVCLIVSLAASAILTWPTLFPI